MDLPIWHVEASAKLNVKRSSLSSILGISVGFHYEMNYAIKFATQFTHMYHTSHKKVLQELEGIIY